MTGFGEAITFYGDRQHDDNKRTALNVQYTEIESKKKSALTLNVEMAWIAGASDAPNWSDKFYLQLSEAEMTSFCELLFGLRPSVEFRFHGKQKNKSLKVYNNNARGVMLELSDAGTSMKHLLSHNQRIELGVFVIRRQALAWKITVSDVLAVLRQSVAISKIRE